ncbi:exodeoxyribonuclease VII large subunit [Anaerovorax odorimutans]|uniref:exodeoxyribonuclease VII large subunit n=1 Tax=Anaerovorax odorimutans TaxID=109327 RepID=UPI0004287B88|nr:exodeoxyribonuclease VII large subunit [Anaerovorax odorimutans]
MAIKPIKVSQLNGYIKRVLQSDPLLGNVSVIGEISNLKYHGTGHVYFTLKDENSKLNCFLPYENLKDIRYELSDGMQITVNGYIYLYERGGSYSLNVRDIIIEGTGNLSIAFQKLKDKLKKEGLFDEKQKKKIPFFPKKIAVITSETGAAVQDIIKIIKSRNNIVDVLIYPCIVQGPNAAKEISNSIDEVNRLFPDIDTIIVGRGGGSIEELWAFNEEIVARSIFASIIPVISAVGHETDFTISDFAADVRAETPSAAAQMAVPDIEALKQYINSEVMQLNHSIENYIKYLEIKVQSNNIETLKINLENRININIIKAENLYKNLENLVKQKFSSYESVINNYKTTLDAFNPYNIMDRGYAAVTDEKGILVSSIAKLKKGDFLTAKLKDGEIDCKIEYIRRIN